VVDWGEKKLTKDGSVAVKESVIINRRNKVEKRHSDTSFMLT